jgi:hypothetical protein
MTVPSNWDKNRICYKDYGYERPGYTKGDLKDYVRKNNLMIVNSEVYLYNVAEKLFKINFKN